MRIASDQFDLSAFLRATERDLDRMNMRPEVVFGESEVHGSFLTKVIAYDNIEGFRAGWTIREVEEYMALDGSAIFSPFAFENQEARLVDCIDGKRRRILAKDGFSLSKLDTLGYLLETKDAQFEISPVVLYGGGCPGPILTVASIPLSSHFWMVMISYLRELPR